MGCIWVIIDHFPPENIPGKHQPQRVEKSKNGPSSILSVFQVRQNSSAVQITVMNKLYLERNPANQFVGGFNPLEKH